MLSSTALNFDLFCKKQASSSFKLGGIALQDSYNEVNSNLGSFKGFGSNEISEYIGSGADEGMLPIQQEMKQEKLGKLLFSRKERPEEEIQLPLVRTSSNS